MRAAASTALKQMRPEAGANPLPRRQRRMGLGERSLAPLAPIATLAPPQERDPPGDRQIPNPHHRTVLDRQRRACAPTTTGHLREQLDLDLELATDFHHARHDHAIDPDKTANVIPHSLFLLGPRLRQREACEEQRMPSYLSLNPARLARPQFSTGAWCTFRFLKLAHFSAPVDIMRTRAAKLLATGRSPTQVLSCLQNLTGGWNDQFVPESFRGGRAPATPMIRLSTSTAASRSHAGGLRAGSNVALRIV
jgi:hypothetical protein